MKQLKSIIILLFIGLCSCCEQEEPRSMNYVPNADSLKLRVMNLGDTNAYETLQIYFIEEPVFEKLAYDSLPPRVSCIGTLGLHCDEADNWLL